MSLLGSSIKCNYFCKTHALISIKIRAFNDIIKFLLINIHYYPTHSIYHLTKRCVSTYY